MVYSLIASSILATYTSFTIALLLGPRIIAFLKKLQGDGQPIRSDGPETHHLKKGTPTMGGLIIIIASSLSQILWCNLSSPYIWLLNATMLAFGAIGFLDDYRKLRYRNSKGVSGKMKLLYQFAAGGALAYGILWANMSDNSNYYNILYATLYVVPFTCSPNCFVALSALWFYFVFSSFVIVGSSNAVNLTDGLDSLSIGPIMMCLVFFALTACGSLGAQSVRYNAQIAELSVYCSSLIGAGLGFLWFNSSPAKIFMGDVGSLPLGAVLGVLSIMLKLELFLVIVGGLFVVEAISVILQVGSFKLRKKRIFRMAPIHHHFEKLGWSENTVVMRFWIFSALCLMLGILAL